MIKAINPRYQLPHKDCFNRVTIPSLYDEVHIDVEKEMADNTFYYSATTDLWSSCATEPYLCYTIHYIDVGLGDITVFSCDTIYFSYRYSRYSDEKYRDLFRACVFVLTRVLLMIFSNMAAVGEQLTEKYGTKSSVWNYFGLLTDENGRGVHPDNPVCKICHTQVRAKW